MSTGYFYADWRQGGSVPGRMSSLPGGALTVLDWLMLQGPSPWTKTVLGTNIASYTAPGGSQISLYVDHVYGPPSWMNGRIRGTVGGQTFPTPAQEAASGSVQFQLASQATAGSNYYYAWYGVRTDRMVLLFGNGSPAATTASTFILAGDMPVYDPADPGLCVVMGSNRVTPYPSNIPSSNNSMFVASTGFSSSIGCGYAYQSKTGGVFSSGAELRTPILHNSTPSLVSYGSVPLMPVTIMTGSVLRGWMPFLYPMNVSGLMFNIGGVAQGDTFNAGSATFEAFRIHDTFNWAWMTNDAESLP